MFLAALEGCLTTQVAPSVPDPAVRDRLAEWLRENGAPPVEYVKHLFAAHDVVFLGEQHRAKHDPLLVQSLLEPLYNNGVRVLAYEFARRREQALLDTLLTDARWDAALARRILFSQSVFWGYEEYMGVLEAAWRLHAALPAGSAPLRIVGMNDAPDWSQLRNRADQGDPRVMSRVWADAILEQVRKGEKVLVYCGIHHAFTRYRQPIVENGRFLGFSAEPRCGNWVHEALGGRATTVFLHAPWNGREGYDAPMRHPADGTVDAVMEFLGPRPTGFHLTDGPSGAIPVKDAVYANGHPDFTLADFCDGWIYTKPISRYEGVTPIPVWIHEGNLDQARAQHPNPDFRDATAWAIHLAIARDAEIPRQWGYLR